MERLSDHFLDQVKTLSYIKTLIINFTPNISEEKLKDVKESVKGMNIIRNIVKMTDPADDGLRMPIPPASLKIKKPKKKKKWFIITLDKFIMYYLLIWLDQINIRHIIKGKMETNEALLKLIAVESVGNAGNY